MNQEIWERIYSMDDDEFREYTKTHNPPLPIPITKDWADSDSPIRKWVKNWIINNSYKTGNLTLKESLYLNGKMIQDYKAKGYKITGPLPTEEEDSSMY